MKTNRRNALSMTAAGLIHVAANPSPGNADDFVANNAASIDLLIRQAADRGHTDLGWLKSYHSFSFGGYDDQRHMGFRSLRVINDPKINATKLLAGELLGYTLERDRHGWLQVVTGDVTVNGTRLSTGDAVANSHATRLHVTANSDADVLLLDLA